MPLDDSQMGAVLAWVNTQHGTTYTLGPRFPVGDEGAWLVHDPTAAPENQDLVLKLEPDVQDIEPMRIMIRTLDLLRDRGYPAPRYVHAGIHPHPPLGRYTLQRLIPGDEAPRIDDALAKQIIAINDLQAGLGPPELVPRGGWRHFVIGPILEDQSGGGAAKNRALRRHSPHTAAFFASLQDYVRAHAGAPMAIADVVHEDFHRNHIRTEVLPNPPAHGRVSPGKITGIIDFEGIVTGDRVFDLVMLLATNRGPAFRARPQQRLWDRACEVAGAPTVGLYLAHILHRHVGYFARRNAPAETIHRALTQAATLLDELQSRTGHPFDTSRLRPAQTASS